jgi:hypothetical protein
MLGECSDYLERGRIRGGVDLQKKLQRGGASLASHAIRECW